MPPWRSVPDPAANGPAPLSTSAYAGAPPYAPPLTAANVTPHAPATQTAQLQSLAASEPPTPVAAPPVAPPPMPVALPPIPPANGPLSPVETGSARAEPPEPREDPRPIIRAAVAEALAPVLRALNDQERKVEEFRRRIDELERRPATPAPPAVSAYAASPASLAPAYAAGYPSAGSAAPAAVLVHRPPVLDVAAIERDTAIVVDGALDGSKRRFRLRMTFAFLLLAIFGGLFFALAHSYTPHVDEPLHDESSHATP